MANIILVNFAEEPGSRVAAFLRVDQHKVHVAQENAHFSDVLHEYGNEIDLVILDASRHEKHVRQFLTELISFKTRNGPRPMALCISHVYRGPRFVLDMERKGARFVYV
jgi:hypothetical protein